MQLPILACDYDGTIARHGLVSESTLKALRRAVSSGIKLILVTGRIIDDLFTTFDHPEIFEWIVGENGAVLYKPETRLRKTLAQAPPREFALELSRRGVDPVFHGDVIVATFQPHEHTVLQTIQEMGLEHQIIFNKGAVMVLPAGVNKAFGLKAAVKEMQASIHDVIAVGDAENDHAFLRDAECSVAVGNALSSLKEKADIVLEGSDGDGVAELIEIIINDKPKILKAGSLHHRFPMGAKEDESEVFFSPYQGNVLIAGSSGAGKSTLATTIIEGLLNQEYQVCLIDPEGDYENFPDVTKIGGAKHHPLPEEVEEVLNKPSESVVANLIGVPLLDRPQNFLKILSRVQDLRAHKGHPHWLVIDEAHHVLPFESKQAPIVLPQIGGQTIFITMAPSSVLLSAMQPLNTVIGVGEGASAVLKEWAELAGLPAPEIPDAELPPGVVIVWNIAQCERPFRLQVKPNTYQRKRHKKKYAEGELPEDRSFYFCGSEGKLKLRAHNLIMFLQLGEGVDEETWNFHLKKQHYSQWIEAAIKDKPLANAIREIETAGWGREESYKAIKKLIEEKYTLPAKSLVTRDAGKANV